MRLEHGRIEDGLYEDVFNGFGIQIPEDLFQRKRVLRSEREQHAFVRRRRLELEVELPAEPFAEGQTPGAIHAAPERRVEHELHPPGIIKKPL